MNLPRSVDDSSLLEHEPLCTYIALSQLARGESRSANKDLVSRFIEAMQQDDQAAAAARTWAYLLFKDVLADESSFEVVGGGKELYKAFLQYQIHLHQGRHYGSTDAARRYQAHVFRTGIGPIIKPKDHSAVTQYSVRGRGSKGRGKGQCDQRSPRPHKVPGPKKVRGQAETSAQHPDAGLARFPAVEAACSDLTSIAGMTISSGQTCGPFSTMNSPATLQEPLLDTCPATVVQPSVLPEAANSSKLSVSKEKKRKASSQIPPVITPSDVSEDDKVPSKTHAATAANSVSHRSKRSASRPGPQPDDLLVVTNQADKMVLAHKPKAKKQPREDPGISQPHPPLTTSQFDVFVSPSNIEDRRGTTSPLSRRKHDEGRILDVSARITRTGSRKPRKIQSVRVLQTRPNKRLRRASISILDGGPGEESESTLDLHPKAIQGPKVQEPLATGPPLTEENIHAQSSARRKRTRLVFETTFAVSHENSPTDPHEFLGPDVRLSRPLPRKVRKGRLLQAKEEGTTVLGVPHGTPCLQHADQLLRDAASNALAILREGTGPDVPDWTQDEEHEAECNDLDGHDHVGANDDQLTPETCAPSVSTPKPPVPAPPRIWAQSRQEVCESFEYFRSYHSGVYSKDDIVKGYLLGAYAACRDIFHHGGKLIISHGGGKSESILLDTRKRLKRYQTDQDQEASDKSVRALLRTYKERRPIALLADDKYALFPYDLASANYTYVVLGFYWISHAWAECQPNRDGSGRIVRWKFAFQWCEGQGDPWWATQQETTGTTSGLPKPISNSGTCLPTNTGDDSSIQCKNCQEQSPFIYKQGWICLNPRCDVFWSNNGEEPKQLDYREEFLSLMPQKFERLPSITPARVVETSGGVTTTYAFSKGWHCMDCGRLSCRYKWEHWECSNCQLKYVVNGRVRSPKEFWHQRAPQGFLHSQAAKDSGILACRLEPINLGPQRGFTNRLTFILPDDRGKIHLILGTPLSNGDADDIFQMYQQQAPTGELKLRRFPLRSHRARGLLLTNYFSQNSGEPYQYVGGSGNTVPFSEAPECVRRALALIKQRSSLALRTDISFNEILSAAYMERQKMAFHSDSEKGLGPVVASLSLGSAALMHFRPHLNVEPKTKSTYALTLVLRHGDVLIMEGDGVQKYYEHTVIPMNFRIAATARCIGST